MKKLFVIAAFALMSFGIVTEVKWKATFSQAEKQQIQLHLVRVYNYIDQTNLPHAEVKFVQGQIDSVGMELNNHLKADSTGK